MFDTVVHGKLIKEGSLTESFVCIDDSGNVAAVRKTCPGRSEYDRKIGNGRDILFPGIIDLHTHLRDPGLTQKEDVTTGTTAAAFGGVTALVDMPNTKPPTLDKASFLAKKEIFSQGSCVDFGLNIVVTEKTSIEVLDQLRDDPAFAGCKVFLGESTGSLVLDDIEILSDLSGALRGLGKPISVHAESGSLIEGTPTDSNDILNAHLRARPSEAEEKAVFDIRHALGETSSLLHFLHISSKRGIDVAGRGPGSVEVTPHHLLLDVKNTDGLFEIPSMGKVNPPLRTPGDRARLWRALTENEIDTIGSDHAPHLLSEKDSAKPPSGIPGTETMLPLMLGMVLRRRIGLYRLKELLCMNPARIAGLSRRGEIKKGNRADMAIVDMKSERKIRAEDLHSKCGWTPFEGMKGVFPSIVISRGELLVENDVIDCKYGRGIPMHI